MDDDIEVLEIPNPGETPSYDSRKRKRIDSLPSTSTDEAPNESQLLLHRVAQLKRRLDFCDKEKELLSKRFKELEVQLTDDQRCQLGVKLESSEKRVPLLCVGDDEEDDDVVFILPEDYSPRKKRKVEKGKTAAVNCGGKNEPVKKDVAITFYKPATNLPHAREHCLTHKFVQSNVTTASVSCNELSCEQCYCFVCDAPVKECDSWTAASSSHCNAYAKNVFWEKLRKTTKRKLISVEESLLNCLHPDEHTQEMLDAAVKATELVDSLKDKMNDASNSSSPSEGCDCDCHYDSCGSYDSYGCGCCDGYSRYGYMYGFNSGWQFCGDRSYNGASNSQRTCVSHISDAVIKAQEYMKSDQPGSAALVLDAVTVVFLAAENDRFYSSQVSLALKSLKRAWIEVLLHSELSSFVEAKVKERLKNAIAGATICSPESTGLKVVLEMKTWSDESLVKCLAGKLGNDLIKEDDGVAEARIAFLEKKKRYTEALFYILGCKVTQRTNSYYGGSMPLVDKTLASIATYKMKIVLFLVKSGKIDQALNVLSLPLSEELHKDILTSTCVKVTASSWNSPQSINFSKLTFEHVKEILSAIVSDKSSEPLSFPSPSAIPEEKMKRALVFILTATQMNSQLGGANVLSWCVETFCESSLSSDCLKENKQEVITQAEKLVNDAKQRFLAANEIKTLPSVPLKVFVVQLIASLTASLYVKSHCFSWFLLSTLGAFRNKNLLWACVSVFLSPLLQNKISSEMLTFLVNDVLQTLGTRCIPLETYKSWIAKGTDINSIEKNYDIAVLMLKEGRRKPGTEGLSLKREAVVLVEELTKSIEVALKKSERGHKERLAVIIGKMKKEFAAELPKWGSKKLMGTILGLCFKNDPTYANFEDVKKVTGVDWPKVSSVMLDFLRKNHVSRLAGCVEVFGRCGLFADVKAALDKSGYRETYALVCEKITQTLQKLKAEEKRQFVEACADWLGKTLCDAAFHHWRSRYTKETIHRLMKTCLKAICGVQVKTFNDVLSKAIKLASEAFSTNTVNAQKRTDLEKWLKDLKALYFEERQMSAWSWAFFDLTTGPLKRKPAVMRQLKTSLNLQTGTIPYPQLIKQSMNMECGVGSSGTKTTSTTTSPKNLARASPVIPLMAVNVNATSGSGMGSSGTKTTTTYPKNLARPSPVMAVNGNATRGSGMGSSGIKTTTTNTSPKNLARASPVIPIMAVNDNSTRGSGMRSSWTKTTTTTTYPKNLARPSPVMAVNGNATRGSGMGSSGTKTTTTTTSPKNLARPSPVMAVNGNATRGSGVGSSGTKTTTTYPKNLACDSPVMTVNGNTTKGGGMGSSGTKTTTTPTYPKNLARPSPVIPSMAVNVNATKGSGVGSSGTKTTTTSPKRIARPSPAIPLRVSPNRRAKNALAVKPSTTVVSNSTANAKSTPVATQKAASNRVMYVVSNKSSPASGLKENMTRRTVYLNGTWVTTISPAQSGACNPSVVGVSGPSSNAHAVGTSPTSLVPSSAPSLQSNQAQQGRK